MKVLLVEDDAIISEGLQYSLRQEGYEVAAAVSQKEALALIQSEIHWIFACWMSCFRMVTVLPSAGKYERIVRRPYCFSRPAMTRFIQ